MEPEWIPEELYADFVAAMPEVCVEVFLETDAGVLVAKRANEPARGEWFWPGGRLHKGERLEDAAHRVAAEELGIEVDLVGTLGVYEHFWGTSAAAGAPSRHTVNVVFRATPAAAEPAFELDDQHTDYRFLQSVETDLHEYVRRYLTDSGVFE
jgi:colanic acid biosynthesis protein WcaH